MSGVPIRLVPIAAGLNLQTNPFLQSLGETPDCLNVDFDRGSVRAAGGAIKFGNKVAPRPGVLCRPSMDGRLPVLYEKSAPVHGHVTIPYAEDQDIGGDFAVAGHGSETDPKSQRVFAARRGKSFGLKVSFKLPDTERLFAAPTNPTGAYAAGSNLRTELGADLALDEVTIIAQKGGDGMTPMSWALGIVNTGTLLDLDVLNGDNLLGVATTLYQARESNYMLVFMWLDAPGFGAWRPSGMRYLLTDGTLSEATDGTGVGDHCTLAYRAVVAPLFVEPGRTYHVELGLSVDTGSAGTGSTPTTAWNSDGKLEIHAKTDDGSIQSFSYDQAAPASATIYRYKGPADNLDYFCRYGIRWSGREEMHLGLGYRCLPWTAAGHTYAGIDSAPLENGGFRITDQSLQTVTDLADYQKPDQAPGAGNTKIVLYQLRAAHKTSETNIEISMAGMVDFGTGLSSNWGLETSVWDGIISSGRHPWGIHDRAWQGLDPDEVGGVNIEALRGYRLVLQADAAGVSIENAGGFMLSIGTMENLEAYGTPAYSYRITPEVGTDWIDGVAASFGPSGSYTINNTFGVTVRCFRWNQRATMVSDFRIYDKARSYTDKSAEFSLWHETDLGDTAEPGAADLVGWWPLSDGGGGVCRDKVAANHGVFAPFAMPVVEAGNEGEKQVYLSGEGERIKLDFSENPVLRGLVRRMQQERTAGFAVQIKFRLTGASYAMQREVVGSPTGGVGVTDTLWEAKFAAPLMTWSVKRPDLVTPVTGDPYYGEGTRVPLHPLLEFGQRVHIPFITADPASATAASEPFFYGMGFEARFPLEADEEGVGLLPPDRDQPGQTGMYSWYRTGSNNFPRYHLNSDWVGRTITVQVGVQPSSTPDAVTVYLAWSPSESLLNSAQNPNAEFTLFQAETMRARDLERSVIVIGGGVDPFERAWCEMGAKVFVDSVRVFGCTAPGDLAASGAGAAVPTGTGKVKGGHTYPERELEEEDILLSVGAGNHAVTVTRGSTTVQAGGNTDFPLGRPELDLRNLLGSFIRIQDEVAVLPQEEQLAKAYPRAYFIVGVTATTLTLATPYEGESKVGVSASTFRLIGYTAFGDDISRKPLPLGKGRPLSYGGSVVDDAIDTSPYWKNVAPGGVDWVVTLLSPVAVGRSRDLYPTWGRGLASPRQNAILGLRSLEDSLFVSGQGSIFEGDDRWRLTGPNSRLNRSIHLRARRDPATGFSMPLQDDRIVLADASSFTFPAASRELMWDAWVWLDDYFPIQTVAWCGRQDTDPGKDAGATGHGISWWLRLRDGRPEFCLGSTGVSTAVVPEHGLFIAKGASRVPRGEWVHIRWFLLRTGANYQLPILFVNGKPVSVIAYQIEDTLTLPDWTIAANDVDPTSDFDLVLGCARASEALVTSSPEADAVLPNRAQGWMHCLGGRLGLFVLVHQVEQTANFDDEAPFNPHGVSYADEGGSWATYSRVLADGTDLGVGHLVEDTKQGRFAAIHGHPLISLYHEMGPSEEPVSMANYGREIYVANGGRVAIIEDGEVRPAGLLAPQSVPDFALTRTPLFELNEFDIGGDVENDGILQLDTRDASVDELLYHYRIPGTSYIRQLGDPDMDWGPDKFFAFACLFKMNSVDGRIPLYSRRNSLRSGGPFIEIRDGYVYFGWWDSVFKKEQFVRTDKAIIEPGYDYYLYARKFYPRKGLNTGTEPHWNSAAAVAASNWANSSFLIDISATEVNARDMLVVRRVPKEDLTNPANYDRWTGYDLKASIPYPGGTVADWQVNASSMRACISFVLADTVVTPSLPADDTYTITGPVMKETATFVDTDSIGLTNIEGRITLDHTGMLLQITNQPSGGSVNFNGKVFRIVEVESVTQVRVVDLDGNVPGFVAADFPPGTDILIGPNVSLVKSDGYDDSAHPDDDTYPIEIGGSQLSSNPLNGLRPFDGVIHSFKYGMFTGTNDADGNAVEEPDIFEEADVSTHSVFASGAEIGTDRFGDQEAEPSSISDFPWSGTSIGQLSVDAGLARTAVDVRPYATPITVASSSQPNKDRKITANATASTSANDLNFSELVEQATGIRRVRTRFLDPKNLAKSFPSAELEVFAAEEDIENPSADLTITLTGLPVSSDPQRTLLQIFMTVADGGEFFLVGEVDSRSDSFSIRLDDELFQTFAAVLDFNEGAPPDAAHVGVAQSAMWYGDISLGGERQLDGLAFSVPFRPEVVPLGQVAPVDTGDQVGVIAIRSFAGQAVIFKRNSIFRASIEQGASGLVLVTQQMSKNDGAVSDQSVVDFEGRLYFVSDRGPGIFFSLTEEPVFIGRRIAPYFKSTIDPLYLTRVSGAVNRLRDQYIFTAKDRDYHLAEDRFSIEFDHPFDGDAAVNAVIAGHRFSKYAGPRVVALGSVVSKDGGPHDLVGGTGEGFLVWMDRSDTRSVMMGPNASVWGDPTLEAGVGGVFEGVFDNVFEGPRGAPLRWLDADGVEQFGYIMSAYLDQNSDLRILLEGDGKQEVPTPVISATVSVGALLSRWSTKDMDWDVPFLQKEGYWLNVTRVPKASGQLKVAMHRDLAAVAEGVEATLDLKKAASDVLVSHIVKEFRTVRAVMKTVTPAVDIDFELLDVTVRAAVTDNR